MSEFVTFNLMRRRARNGRVTFWMGVVLVLAMFAASTIASFSFLVISFPGADVDIGPAIIGTVGFLCVYLGRRVSRELVEYSAFQANALLPMARQGDQTARAEYDCYLKLWYRLAKGRWIAKLLGWLLTLVVGAALAGSAAWLFVSRPDFEERDVLFWAAIVCAAFMMVRLFLDWPGRPPRFVKQL